MATQSSVVAVIPYAKIAGVMFGTAAVPAIAYGLHDIIAKGNSLYRILWVVAFAINVISVSIPGRFDGEQVDNKVAIPWETVFAPAGYAFAIWGAIYIGEFLLTIYMGISGQPMKVFRPAVTWWLMGNLFQSLWCASFRPQFKSVLWLPTLLLALGALSFFMLQRQITSAIVLPRDATAWSQIGLWLMRAPISLHTGWLTAAALLNLNGYAAVSNISMGKQVALALASAYVAAAAGGILSVWTQDPLLALTVAWALTAVAYQTKHKSTLNLHADTKEALALTESWLAKALVATALSVPLFAVKF
eukprot:gene12429-26142_t